MGARYSTAQIQAINSLKSMTINELQSLCLDDRVEWVNGNPLFYTEYEKLRMLIERRNQEARCKNVLV